MPLCLPAEVLEHAAYLGMAAMLVGPLFSADVPHPQASAELSLRVCGHEGCVLGGCTAWCCSQRGQLLIEQLNDAPQLSISPPPSPRLQSRVFAWVDRMLSAPAASARLADWGPPKAAVARSALTLLLQSSGDLAKVFVDRSYAADRRLAAGYFQVLLRSAVPLLGTVAAF